MHAAVTSETEVMKKEADLYIVEVRRRLRNQDKEKTRRQIRKHGFDTLQDTLMLDTFPVSHHKVRKTLKCRKV